MIYDKENILHKANDDSPVNRALVMHSVYDPNPLRNIIIHLFHCVYIYTMFKKKKHEVLIRLCK